MKQEIEIKLALAPSKVNSLLESSFFKQLGGFSEQKILRNDYYDTVDRLLNSKKIALRVRMDGDDFIQTFKAKGASENGLHQRLEWEWPLPSATLDLTLLPSDQWDKSIGEDQLQLQFRTEFTRCIWYVEHIGVDGNRVKIEMVLDQGFVSAPSVNERIAISELELELMEGSELALRELADILVAQCPDLTPSNTSKAAWGYQLLGAAGR